MNPFPSICRTARLTPKQRQAILLLTEYCREHDSISLAYPLSAEEAVLSHYLLTDSRGQLLSALALLPLDDSTLECIAFTDPCHRKKGCFSRLLSLALEDCKEQDLLFPVSGSCADTLAVMDALGAELFRQELQMERDLSLPLFSPCLLSGHEDADLLAPDDIFSENALWRLAIPGPCRTCPVSWDIVGPCRTTPVSRDIVGSCRTTPVSRDILCLHEVEILPSMRGQGLGTALLCRLLSFLQEENRQRREPMGKLLLHVSADNPAAVALYKKTGFRITETLSYYWY